MISGFFANQPLAADRETAHALRLGNSRLLQQGETAATRADEDEFCVVRADDICIEIPDADFPAGVRFLQADDAMIGGDTAVVLSVEPVDQLAGDRAEIDIGAVVHLGRRDRNIGAVFNEQRRPTTDGGAVGGKVHFLKKMVGGHSFVACL